MKRRFLILCLSFIIVAGTRPGLAQQSDHLPLSEAGPYATSVLTMTLVDKARADERLDISIWYPAAQTSDANDKPTSGPAVLRESSPLKKNPTLKSPNITNMDAGTPITIMESQGRWTHIALEDGSSGWIILEKNTMGRPAKPDLSGAPYPLIIYSYAGKYPAAYGGKHRQLVPY